MPWANTPYKKAVIVFRMANQNQDIPASLQGIIAHFNKMRDFRIDRTKRHELLDIFVIAVCAGIAGVKTWTGVEEFARARVDWFGQFLNLKHGAPSHDTFRRIFMLMDTDEFIKIFTDWMKEVVKDSNIEQICIDGKTLRRSFTQGKKTSALHIVNAWSTGTSLCLAQLESEGKKNEIKTIPKILNLINPKGCIVSLDAMGCQVEIAEKIVSQGGDYLFGLKGNQGTLEGRVKELFNSLPVHPKDTKKFTVSTFKTEGEGHGRKEIRNCTVLREREDQILGMNVLNKWPLLTTFIEVDSKITNKASGEFREYTRYYISSADFTGEDALSSVRKHWEVENKLHWSLDVTFREDDSRNRTGNSGNNCSILRKIAFNLLNMDPSDKTLPLKQQQAAGDNSYLLKVLLRNCLERK